MVNFGLNYKDNVSQLISWGHWFSFFNIGFALIISSRYLFQATWPETVIGQLYLFVSWLGHFSFLIFIFYLLLLFPLSFLIPRQRALRFIGALLATVGLSILALDTEIFAQFHRHLNPYYFSMISSVGKNHQAQSWHLFYVLIPLLFIIELVFSNYIWRKRKRLNKYRIGNGASVFFLVCFLLTHLIYIWADAAGYSPIIAQKINYPVSYPMTAKSFLLEHGFIQIQIDDEQSRTLFPEQFGQFKYPLRPVKFKQQTENLNVLFLVVDALRFDMLNPINMPNLSNLSQKSLRFDQHFSASNHSSQGIFGLFYGLPSSYQSDVVNNNQSPLLMETFSRQGYDIYQGNNAVKNNYVLASSFKRNLMSGRALHNNGADGDIIMVNEWKNWLSTKVTNKSSNTSPWVSYLLFNSAADYQVPKDFASPFNVPEQNITQVLMSDDNKQSLLPSYKNSVYFVDSLLGDIFNFLDNQHMLKTTLVLVTSSSGQEFNDTQTNAWGSGSNFSQFQTQVPLVLHWPDKQAKIITQKTSHLDIVPTLMQSVLSVSTSPETYSSGNNLLNLPQRNWLLLTDSHQYAILQDDKIVQFNKQGDYQIFDRQYHELPSPYNEMQTLLQVVHELQRFHQAKSQIKQINQ